VPYFFLSYSRKDVPGGFLYKFFEDLCRELSIRGESSIHSLDSIGFLDKDQLPGVNWATNTGESLGTCKIFVPVYSPSYFDSSYCGKEWHAFSRRLASHQQAHGTSPASIVPCLWVELLEEPPRATRLVQDTRARFGPEYQEFGLRYLMQLKENESKYQDFLVKFTMMLVTAGKQQPLDPLEGIDLLTEDNAFAVEARPGKSPRSRLAGAAGKRVTFVVAAAGRDEMEVVRTTLDVYGDDWTDWRPYHPLCSDSIWLRALDVARAQRMLPMFDSIGEKLFGLLEKAQESNELVVVIVDPWAVGLTEYKRILNKLDGLRYRTTAIVVPWESADAIEAKVRDALYLCLENWVESGERVFRQDICSMEEFEKILGQVIIEIRSRILRRAEVARRVLEGGPRSRPILANPGG
jgi:FxsC-like protein